MLSLITFPSSTEAITGIGEWSSPLFTDLLDWVWVVVGITIGVLIINIIINWVFSLFSQDEE